MISFHVGDCLAIVSAMEPNSIDAIVTDPPYGLTQGKRGGTGEASMNIKSPQGRSRITTGGGFMGKAWDAGVPGPEYWSEFLRVAKPGSYMLAFGGTRTFHRLGVAIEDGGWEIYDTVLWLYGQGMNKVGYIKDDLGQAMTPYGGSLKPCWEPILVCRKPYVGTIARNIQTWGTGALNIDGCRIPVDAAVDDPRLGGNGTWGTEKMAKNVYEGGYAGKRVTSSPLGRWPANAAHDGSDEVTALFPVTTSGTGAVKRSSAKGYQPNAFGVENRPAGTPNIEYGDTGNASRFLYCAKASGNDRWFFCADCADAYPDSERDKHSHGETFKQSEIPQHLIEFFEPTGGGNGVGAHYAHPT